MNFKKRVNGLWTDTPHYIHKTDTDILTLPQTIYGDGTNATVGLKGNTVQNGTPTPSNPVDVNGVGVRTENLFDWSAVTTGYRIAWTTGEPVQDANAIMSDFIPVSTGIYRANASFNLVGYAADKSYLGVYDPITTTFRKEYGSKTSYYNISNTNVAYVKLMSYTNTDTLSSSTMFSAGMTALPYEPYGYKIPISNGQQTTNIYLGSTQTVRQIRKLVLTGNESWQKSSDYTYYIGINGYLHTGAITSMSTHYFGQTNVLSGDPIAEGSCCFYYGAGANVLYLKNITPYSTLQDFRAYLADQYANGTPVTVWYVLATPETVAVNEPLMKIGDYADSLTTSIPTTDGANSLSVDTTVQPSEVTANFHGWHPVAVAHEAENGAWT